MFTGSEENAPHRACFAGRGLLMAHHGPLPVSCPMRLCSHHTGPTVGQLEAAPLSGADKTTFPPPVPSLGLLALGDAPAASGKELVPPAKLK